MIVQVKRPPSNVKKAFMTRDIALDGTYLILLPSSDSLGVSSRVRMQHCAAVLRETGRALKPHGMGIVMRAAATDADMDMLKAELDALMQRWRSLQSAQAHGSAPRLSWDGEDMLTPAATRRRRPFGQRYHQRTRTFAAGFSLPGAHGRDIPSCCTPSIISWKNPGTPRSAAQKRRIAGD